MNSLRACAVITGFLLATCCLVYPALVTGASSVLFSHKASGSLIVQGDKVVGSELIGQTFDKPEAHPEYFWSRPSAASVDSATGILYSSGSNYGPLNGTLEEEVKGRVEALHATGAKGPVPVDLVTKSASGLDPHISPAAAALQIPRVARARALPEAEVNALVGQHTEGRTLGLLGEPRVNVLMLNLALDQRTKRLASLHVQGRHAFAVTEISRTGEGSDDACTARWRPLCRGNLGRLACALDRRAPGRVQVAGAPGSRNLVRRARPERSSAVA